MKFPEAARQGRGEGVSRSANKCVRRAAGARGEERNRRLARYRHDALTVDAGRRPAKPRRKEMIAAKASGNPTGRVG